MEKVNIYDLEGKRKGILDKPKIFYLKPRKDLIEKSFEISQSRAKQSQGRDKRVPWHYFLLPHRPPDTGEVFLPVRESAHGLLFR